MALSSFRVDRPKTITEIVKMEREHAFTREVGIIKAAASGTRVIKTGAVLGRILFGTVTVAADVANTGDAVLTAVEVTLGRSTKVGTYTLTCKTEVTNAGVFAVVDPDGYALPDLTVAAAYANPHLGLTIPDGTTDWAAGDVITVTVAAGTGKLVAYDPEATDGTQIAAAIAAAPAETTTADVSIPVIVREAIVGADALVYETGTTTAEKAQALADLAKVGILAPTLV